MVVANEVVSDTRVRKAAATVAQAGHDVVVLGYSPAGRRTDERLGAARMVRLPLAEPPRVVASVLRGAGVVGALSPLDRRLRPRDDLAGRLRARLPVRGPAWARGQRTVALLEPRVRRELAALAPDLVHAHDVTGLGLAGRYIAERRAAGGAVALVYDAHEHVREMPGLIAMEDANIGLADGVVTVSEPIADALRREHDLAVRPTVVLNAPLRRAEPPERTLRQALGLDADVPLLVYPGNVKAARGLATAIDGLPALVGVHLALVTVATPYVETLAERARALGCGDRVHVVPYVPTAQVSPFIADATAGINPLRRYPNADVALPNKVFEYLHAGLPMIVSDTRAVAALVRDLGVGEVHPAGDTAAFVAAVRKVLGDPERYRLDAARGGVLEELSWERQGERLLEVYRAITAADAGVGP